MSGENWEQTLLFADTVPQGLEAPDLFQDLRGTEAQAFATFTVSLLRVALLILMDWLSARLKAVPFHGNTRAFPAHAAYISAAVVRAAFSRTNHSQTSRL